MTSVSGLGGAPQSYSGPLGLTMSVLGQDQQKIEGQAALKLLDQAAKVSNNPPAPAAAPAGTGKLVDVTV